MVDAKTYLCSQTVQYITVQKKFITNLAFLLFLNLLVKPFWIVGINTAVQNRVGAEEFGFYFAVLNFSFLFNILLDLGITNFNNRNIAQHHQLLNKHFSSILSLRGVLVLLYFVVTVLFALAVGYSGEQMKMLLVLGFNQALVSFILYLRSNLSGLHLFKQDSIISVLDRFLLIAFCSILLWGNVSDQPFKIDWFVYAQTIAYSITAGVALTLVLRKSKRIKLRWDWPFSLVILKKSLPFALLFLLMTFYNRMDSVMLERLLPHPMGAEQSGIYAQGFRLLEAANMIALLFAGLLLPMYARMLKLKQQVEDLTALSFKLLISGAIVLATACYFYSTEIMGIMYKQYVAESALTFRVLILTFIATSITYIFGTLLTANNNLKHLNIMAGVGVLMNVALNWWLIPYYEAYGSAIATLITQFFTAFVQLALAQYIFKFKINYKLLISLVVFTAGMVLMANYSYLLFENWMWNLAALFAAGVLWAFLTGMISLKALYRIVKQEE